jgi:hypothetical protein
MKIKRLLVEETIRLNSCYFFPSRAPPQRCSSPLNSAKVSPDRLGVAVPGR